MTQQEMEKALAAHIGCDWSELEPMRFDHYGLDSFQVGKEEWAIGSDDDVDDAVCSSIKDSLWAFRASFILEACGLPFELEEAFHAWQEKGCEGCNNALYRLICKTGDFADFVIEAVRCDGRGHFLSSYDGEEVQLDTPVGRFYAFRIN